MEDDGNLGLEMGEVVIIGAGISGLAMALALHKKGFKSIVMERSEALRTATGTAIGIRPNGWRALDQLGVADDLRHTAVPIRREKTISLDDGKLQEVPIGGETRCLRRKDLIDTLYDALPRGTVRFGCQLESIKTDLDTTKPVLRFIDGTSMLAKVVIGCDGGKSIVADYLNLKPTKMLSFCAGRGLSIYPNGHSFDHEFLRIWKENNLVGRTPIDNNLVYWFCALPIPRDETIWKEPEEIRQTILDLLHDYPHEIREMIERAEEKSLSSTYIRYRAPWDLLAGTFSKGTVTVAGDAMHVMGPFLGQGGSAGLEDAIVLARNLGQMGLIHVESRRKALNLKGVGEAFNQYIKERKMRVVRLSLQTYLTGLLIGASSRIKKVMCIVVLFLLFGNQGGHVDYDCGGL